ncbi:MAG: UbiA family prenyltransferase [Thermoplasmata archaeon]|nr:UbiA family prenyltransferase [Thermoplasmata archaeon]
MASVGATRILKGCITMVRPGNCAMAAVAGLLAAVICSSSETVVDRAFEVVASMVVVVAFVGAGNSMNDFFDRELDRIAHPSRPIPLGIISPRTALMIAATLFAIAVGLSLTIGLESFLIVVTSLAFIVAYEVFLKSEGLAGNLAISWLTAALFLFGGAAVGGLELAWILAALAFMATLGREIVKDIQDVAGDERSRMTLPMRLGRRNAGIVASAALSVAVVLSPMPYLLSLLSAWYIPFLAVADTVFIYSAMIHFAAPEQGQKTIKTAMLIALVAFLVGGIA